MNDEEFDECAEKAEKFASLADALLEKRTLRRGVSVDFPSRAYLSANGDEALAASFLHSFISNYSYNDASMFFGKFHWAGVCGMWLGNAAGLVRESLQRRNSR